MVVEIDDEWLETCSVDDVFLKDGEETCTCRCELKLEDPIGSTSGAEGVGWWIGICVIG